MDDPKIWVRKSGLVAIVTYHEPPGPTPSKSFPTLRLAVDDGENNLVLDLTGVTYLSSARLGGIVTTIQRLHSGKAGKMSIVCPEGDLREVFAVSRLDQVLTLYASLDEALARLKGP